MSEKRKTSRRVMLAVMAVTAASTLIGSLSPAPARAPDPAAPAPATMAEDVFIGAPDAPVTLIEYASFTCAHCAVFNAEVMPAIKAEYVDSGKVRFAVREAYMDLQGLMAGQAARAVLNAGGPEAYYAFSDALYRTQDHWAFSVESREQAAERIRALAAEHGADPAAVESALNDAALAETLVSTFMTRARADGVEGTPTFVINGAVHKNMGLDSFRTALDTEIAKAESGEPR